ncbi:MAG: hypothetical protein KDK48_01840, partial [Chlamydiia bacterium]|nr:hypothetical protein [Chlamydiia bacterium]
MRILSLLLLACCSLFGELSLKEKIVLGLYHNKILKTNVTLSDGQVAPIYIDLRDVFSFPELSDQITEAYREIAQDLHYDHVCGAPLAGIPLATK